VKRRGDHVGIDPAEEELADRDELVPGLVEERQVGRDDLVAAGIAVPQVTVEGPR